MHLGWPRNGSGLQCKPNRTTSGYPRDTLLHFRTKLCGTEGPESSRISSLPFHLPPPLVLWHFWIHEPVCLGHFTVSGSCQPLGLETYISMEAEYLTPSHDSGSWCFMRHTKYQGNCDETTSIGHLATPCVCHTTSHTVLLAM